MSECYQQPSRPYNDELQLFHQRLHEVRQGEHPALSPAQRGWLRIFNEVARCFRHTVRDDESYCLSLEALWRCAEKGKASNDKYVMLACHRKHLDFINYRRRKRKRKPDAPLPEDHADGRDYQARVDARLDLEEAVAKLRETDPRWETAVRMQLAGHTYGEIADRLGVCERTAFRLTNDARRRLRDLLTDYGS